MHDGSRIGGGQQLRTKEVGELRVGGVADVHQLQAGVEGLVGHHQVIAVGAGPAAVVVTRLRIIFDDTEQREGVRL